MRMPAPAPLMMMSFMPPAPMTSGPVIVSPDATLAEAEELMRCHQIKSLLVSGDGHTLEGILDLYDIR